MGFAEKTCLTYDLVHDYKRICRETESNIKKLFNELAADGTKKVALAGVDEVAEIAYITLPKTAPELAVVVDEEIAGKTFFGGDI